MYSNTTCIACHFYNVVLEAYIFAVAIHVEEQQLQALALQPAVWGIPCLVLCGEINLSPCGEIYFSLFLY